MFFRLPWLCARKEGSATDKSSQILIKKRTKTVLSFLDAFSLTANQCHLQHVLVSVGSRLDFAVIPRKEFELNIEQMTALRDRVPTTTRGMERLANGLQNLRPQVCRALFPSQLRKQISSYETCSIPIDLGFEMKSLEMGGEKKDMKVCLLELH